MDGGSIRIRGTAPRNASNDPLIVLDGIPYDETLASINPGDIESIDVLKDASSTAIYGARGANVIWCDQTGQTGQDDGNLRRVRGCRRQQLGSLDVMDADEYRISARGEPRGGHLAQRRRRRKGVFRDRTGQHGQGRQ